MTGNVWIDIAIVPALVCGVVIVLARLTSSRE